MRILCILEKSPLPDKTGSRRRVLRLINHLSQISEIQTIVVSNRLSSQEIQLLGSVQKTPQFPPTSVLAPKWRRPGLRERSGWLLGETLPFTWQSQELAPVIDELRLSLIGFKPDIVWVASAILTAAVVPDDVDVPIVIDVAHREREAVDSYLRASFGGAGKLRRAWKQVVLTALDRSARVKAEAHGLGRASLVTTCSTNEAEGIGDVTTGNVVLVRNGVDVPDSLGWDPSSRRLLFVGNLGYAPNLDAVGILVHEVLPQVRRAFPDAQLHIVGDKPAETIEFGPSESVTWHGFVDDLTPHYASAGLVVAPLSSGSGTKLKVLEAFANGVPVVTTPTGVAGLDVTAGHEVSVGDSVAELVRLAVALMGNPTRAEAQRDLARAWVERTHTWEAAGAELRRSIERLVEPTLASET